MRLVAVLVGFVVAAAWAGAGERDPDDYEIVGWTSFGGSGPYTGAEPDIAERQLAVYADLLGLDAERRELMALAHESYVVRYRSRWLEWAERVSDLEAERRAERDPPSRGRRLAEINSDRDELAARFLEATAVERERLHEEVRLLLTSTQAREWERVERYLRRDRFFGRSLGFNAAPLPRDVVDALDALREVRGAAAGLGPEELDGLDGEGLAALPAGVDALVRAFEVTLDGLIDRYEAARDVVRRTADPNRTGPDGERLDRETRQREVILSVLRADEERAALVRATRRFERELKGVLPAELAAAFGEAMVDRMVPRSNATLAEAGASRTRFEGMVDGVAGVTAEQSAAIAAIDAERAAARAETLRAFAPLIERERERLSRREATGEGDALGQIEVNYANGAVNIGLRTRAEEGARAEADPNASERSRLSMRLFEIEQAAVERLRGVLTEEQRMGIARR